MRAHAEGNSGCVGAHHATSQDRDVGGGHAGHTTQQNAASAHGPLQILGAHLHGHAACDFAHGSEERERAIALHQGFVGDAVYAVFHQFGGQVRQGSQMEISEKG